MTSEQKQQHWQQLFNDWQQSQLSQKDFCKNHDLNLATFGYWRTKLCTKTAPKPKFIPVTIQKPLPWIKVFLPGGIRLEIPSHSFSEFLPLLTQSDQEAFDVAP